MIQVEVNNTQKMLSIDESRLADAVRSVLAGEGVSQAHVSVAIVDATTMHALNLRHLNHDYATDVLSFLLEQSEHGLEGEIIVSADEAALNAPRFHWSPEVELTLYAIHGSLHLCGYDDLEPPAADVMRTRERHWLAVHGLSPTSVATLEGSFLTTTHGASEERP